MCMENGINSEIISYFQTQGQIVKLGLAGEVRPLPT